MSQQDEREIMGTAADAKASLIEHTREWRELRQPRMATAKEHRRVQAAETEARFRLANAALIWLWHEENADVG